MTTTLTRTTRIRDESYNDQDGLGDHQDTAQNAFSKYWWDSGGCGSMAKMFSPMYWRDSGPRPFCFLNLQYPEGHSAVIQGFRKEKVLHMAFDNGPSLYSTPPPEKKKSFAAHMGGNKAGVKDWPIYDESGTRPHEFAVNHRTPAKTYEPRHSERRTPGA